MSSVVLETLVTGALLGLMYGLTGMGLTFTMGYGKTMNVAHGTLIILGAFFALGLFDVFHLNVVVMIIGVLILFGLVGGVLDRSLLRYLHGKSEIIGLLVLFGLAEVIENVTSWIWTGNLQGLTVPSLEANIKLGSVSMPKADLLAAVLAIIVAGAMYAFLHLTYTGKAIRASVQSDLNATVVGINTERIRSIIFLLGILLAGLAGVAVALLFPFAPQDQDQWLIMAFVVVVVGGVDNIVATLVAGLAIGLAQAAAGLIVPFQYENLILYAFLAIALIVRNGQSVRNVRTM